MRSIHSDSAEATMSAAEKIFEYLQPGDIIALSGSLGAGKTVFVQGIAEALKIEEPVTSPTFTLISEYTGTMPLYHMDLYRIAGPEEFNWLGTEEILNGDGITLIEWSERAENELPERTIHVNIEITGPTSRLITIKGLPEK